MSERQTDFELLRSFVRADQRAFADVVRRHLDLVYATALRKTEEESAAEEVAQNVFAALAKKAWQFGPDDSLPAWLYRTTLLEAREWLRGELRRRRREQTAAELGTTMKTPDESTAFRALVPLLDEALLSLREKDRTALLLRFYESQSLRDVGASLGVNEDAAQKRVAAALEKLAGFFQRRGYRTATVAAAIAALQHTASSAPSFMAAPITQAAAAAATPATGLTAIAARLVALSRLQKALLCAALLTVPAVWYRQAASRGSHDAPTPVVQPEEASQPDVNPVPEFLPVQPEEPASAEEPAPVPGLADNQVGTVEPVRPDAAPAGGGVAGRRASATAGSSPGPRLTGLVDLPGFKAAFLNVTSPATNRAVGSPPAADTIRTNHLLLVDGESPGESAWLTQPTMEILEVDTSTGTVRIHEDGKESVYVLAPARGGDSNIRLRKVRLREVLMLYGAFRGRTVLCHPAVEDLELSFELLERDQTKVADSLRGAFRRMGVVTAQLGERFEAVYPSRQTGSIMEVVRKVKLPPSDPGAALIPIGAIQLRDLELSQAQVIYGEFIGRKPVPASPPAGHSIFLVNQTPLTKAEATYAFDILFGWQDLKVVFESRDSFRLVAMKHR